MAEFKRVMGILKRKYESMGMYDFDYDKMEQEALQWESEHPGVYPTWGDWLAEQGVIIKDKIGENKYMYNTLRKISTPIPADIAKKLGIEPKEG